jgi:hypothetical protein
VELVAAAGGLIGGGCSQTLARHDGRPRWARVKFALRSVGDREGLLRNPPKWAANGAIIVVDHLEPAAGGAREGVGQALGVWESGLLHRREQLLPAQPRGKRLVDVGGVALD